VPWASAWNLSGGLVCHEAERGGGVSTMERSDAAIPQKRSGAAIPQKRSGAGHREGAQRRRSSRRSAAAPVIPRERSDGGICSYGLAEEQIPRCARDDYFLSQDFNPCNPRNPQPHTWC